MATGVSDLEVLQVAKERGNTEVRLLDQLHAKLYVADDQCLVGSANLTASALGWSDRSNLELLISAKSTDSDVSLLLDRLETAVPATEEACLEIRKLAAAISPLSFDEVDTEAPADAFHLPWMPRCAAPDRLYEIYKNPETTSVVDETRKDGLADLRDLLIHRDLSLTDFNAIVRNSLRLMPTTGRIIAKVPEGITDEEGVRVVENAHNDILGSDARLQWRIIRDWIGVFYKDEFEVAPDSFIIRLRPPSDRLETPEHATEQARSEVNARAVTLRSSSLDEALEMIGDAGAYQRDWLPCCAAPDKLYEIYLNSATTVVVEGTRDDGLADIRDLLIPSGLAVKDFNHAVRNALQLMPGFVRIIDEVPKGVADANGIGLVQEACPDLKGQDAQVQWRIIRDWIGTFFTREFEVAPESFVIRLRAH